MPTSKKERKHESGINILEEPLRPQATVPKVSRIPLEFMFAIFEHCGWDCRCSAQKQSSQSSDSGGARTRSSATACCAECRAGRESAWASATRCSSTLAFFSWTSRRRDWTRRRPCGSSEHCRTWRTAARPSSPQFTNRPARFSTCSTNWCCYRKATRSTLETRIQPWSILLPSVSRLPSPQTPPTICSTLPMVSLSLSLSDCFCKLL